MCGGQRSGRRVLFRVPFVVPRRGSNHCCPVKNGEKEKRCKSVGFPTNVCSIATYFFEFNYIVIYEGGKTECVPFFHFFRSRSQREDNGCVRTCGEALSHIYIGQKRKGNTKLSHTHGKAKWGKGEIEFRTAAGKTPRGGLERKGVTFFLIVWSVSYFLLFCRWDKELNKERKKRGGVSPLYGLSGLRERRRSIFCIKIAGKWRHAHARQSKSGFTMNYLK